MTARSSIDVDYVTAGRRGEWMVVQRMNAEDAREVAYALGLEDGAAVDLLAAAEEADQRNTEASR
jgi:hypothetical protein